MKALSIRQPWAWAILYAGKDVENRDWSDRYAGYRDAHALIASGEQFLIHASGGMTNAEYMEFNDTMISVGIERPFPKDFWTPSFNDLKRGGIVGAANLSGIVTEHPSPWFFGPVGLVIAGARSTKFIPLKGSLGFFNVPGEIAREALG